jgi:hypothetical protein
LGGRPRFSVVLRARFKNRFAGSLHRNGASPLAYRDAKLPDQCPQPEERLSSFETRSKQILCVLDTKYKDTTTPATDDVAQIVAYAE